MDITLVEPQLDAVRPFRTVLADAFGYGRPWSTVWAPEEMVELLGERSGTERVRAYVGSVDGEPVTAGWARMPLLDNVTSAEIELGTSPEHRRRGYGGALLEHLESVVSEHGRSVLQGIVSLPEGVGPDDSDASDLTFARTRGWRVGQLEIMRQLDLPVAEEGLDSMAKDAAAHHAAYTIATFTRPVPDSLVESYAALQALLMTEAPTGEMTREPETPDPAAVRRQEELMVAQARTSRVAVALDPDGSVVAYSELITGRYDPDRAFQSGTLVDRDHRGHRLGMAVKVAGLRMLQREAPEVRRIVTWNAETNAPMIGINEALGYRVLEVSAEVQKVL